MVDTHENIEFREESDDGSTRESSIKEIVLRQIRKVGDICSKEFTGGYWEKKPIKTSGGVMFSEEYHEDVREAYCVAVEFIIDLVYAVSDNEFKKIVDLEEKKEFGDNINDKLKSRKYLFRQMNMMFEREGFFENSDSVDE